MRGLSGHLKGPLALWMPSKLAVWTNVACSGSGHLPLPSPTTVLAYTPAGCGHGGTR